MTLTDIDTLARERADRYAPLPKWNPAHAGFLGAAIVGFPLCLFMGLAGLNPDAFAGAGAITVAIGFLVPFGFLKYQEHQHAHFYVQEFAALKAANDSPERRHDGQ